MDDRKFQSVPEIEAELKRVELETAQLDLEAAKERNAQLKSDKEVRSRRNKQRMAQLRTDLLERKKVIESCNHRQGGSPGMERKGTGKSALQLVIMPDNRQLVMCANCPLRVFSPLETNQDPELREGETVKKRDARVASYKADLEGFNALATLAQEDKATPEAGTAMHCGKTFEFRGKDGNHIIMPAPCDSYAQGADNRKIA